MTSRRPATYHNPVGTYTIFCGMGFHPCDRMLSVMNHSHKISFWKKTVGYIHDHMSLTRQVPKKGTSAIIFVQEGPRTPVQVDKTYS
jgi:hypothetical protein